MRKLLAALVAAVAVPAAVTVVSEARAADYIVYLHGRGWSSWNGEVANVPGWTNVTFGYNGSARINGPETNNVIKPALRQYCSAGNRCVVHCYSAGCYRMLKATYDLVNVDKVPLDGLLWAQATASAAGGSKLAEMSTRGLTGFLAKLLGQQEKVDFDLTPGTARNTYGYIQNAFPALMYHSAGNRDICKKFLWGAIKLCANKNMPGAADGAVAFDSSTGASAPGAYWDGCASPKYAMRAYDPRTPCGGEGRDHFGMPAKGSAVVGAVLGGWANDYARNWSDDTTGAADCNDANGECDGQFNDPSLNYSMTPAGQPVAGSCASTASNTVGSTAGGTCAGKCGGKAGTCWCDSTCTLTRDCCADYFQAKCDIINNTNGTGPGRDELMVGETPDWGYSDRRWMADWNGDRKADYCRAVGNSGGAGSYMMCSLSTGTGRSDAYVAAIGDWGYSDRRWMIDWNGDRKTDYCRAVGNSGGSGSYLLCSLSNGQGSSDAYVATVGDWGYSDRRWMIDWNGDGKADYCRAVGNTSGYGSYLLCSLSTGNGSRDVYVAAIGDWGYSDRRWMIDWNGDGKTDFCRAVGNSSGYGSYLQCTISTGDTSYEQNVGAIGDWGYSDRRWMTDWNGDGRADYCRAVGNSGGYGSYLQCAFSSANGVVDVNVGEIQDWGYSDRRWMIDWDGDGKSDYCRATGNSSGPGSYLDCALSTGTRRSLVRVGETQDWGYSDRRWMADWNGDGKTDFVRAVGNSSGWGSWLLGSFATAPQ